MISYVLVTGPGSRSIPADLPAKATSKGPLRLRVERIGNTIEVKGKTAVELPFRRAEGDNTGEVQVIGQFFKHRALLGVVQLAGAGVAGIRSPSRFVEEGVCQELNDWAHGHEWRPGWAPIALKNSHFQPSYWGENITAKSAYNRSRDRLSLRISSQDVLGLEAKIPFIREVFEEGTIRWIRGVHSDLDSVQDGKRVSGKFVLTREGVLKTDYSDISTIVEYFKKIVSQGFLGVTE